MGAEPERHFPASYAAGREAFLRAAEARGAVIGAYPIAERGVAGEELAMDVAYVGPEAPSRLVVVSSGIHGVEGFAGSALQHRLLQQQLDGLALPPDMGLLAIHALNPWGFAHRRRVNESNVDLNRNFLSHPEEHPANPGYEELHDAINPESLHPDSEAASRARMADYARENGAARLQEVLSCGQYVHAHGVQFGGTRDEASNRRLREIVRRETRGAPRIAWLDLHTGLGPYGVPEMITEVAAEHPAYLRGRTWYGDAARSTASGDSVSARLHGVMERGLEAELPADSELSAFAAEFGTYAPNRVFWAMRADNWLRHHGDLDSGLGRAIQAELVEVFCPADPRWRRTVLEAGERILRQTRDGLARP